MKEEEGKKGGTMYNPFSDENKLPVTHNPHLYNPKEKEEKIVDKQKLAQTLQSIGEKLDSIPWDAMLEMMQMGIDGSHFKISIEYPKIMERLYRERTVQLIKELGECL